MENVKLFDAELRLMEIVWDKAPISAKELSLTAAEEIGWNKNTTYTVLKKLVEKGAIKRTEPNFICEALITREQVQIDETKRLIDRLYEGSLRTFFSSFLRRESLSEEELQELKKIIKDNG
ncbi:MAG: BlaI/MecI/CopY family transcriptional regulator [Bacillota bacterium]|nr:BlaI/MecI/CopY family transcriptional regulator [Bacillota bacterium]